MGNQRIFFERIRDAPEEAEDSVGDVKRRESTSSYPRVGTSTEYKVSVVSCRFLQ